MIGGDPSPSSVNIYPKLIHGVKIKNLKPFFIMKGDRELSKFPIETTSS
jgi:hypothetical protein